ncbi:MAG TPA: phospholipase D family protein [Burkholderiales bacterium]|nr:phospholipase D family protein [Burkholderiales bacterium]
MRLYPPRLSLMLRAAAAALLLAAIASCSTLQRDIPVTPSHSFDRPEETTLGRAYQADQANRPGLSGFRLINGGVSALMTRAALADLAERAIDVQYYIYERDAVGAFLMERLIAAAERGVRVRMLLDDLGLGFEDVALARLADAYPQIEIRIFNPFTYRARWSRPLQLTLQLDRLGMRMHNKVFVADGQIAVVGGRNISNNYFEAEEESNFRDVDVLAAGPIVKEVARHFDEYWNSPVAFPVAALGITRSERAGPHDVEDLRQFANDTRGPHAQYERRKSEFTKRILAGGADLIWAKGEAVAELPVRNTPDPANPVAAKSQILRTLANVRREAKNEVVMVMAYYIPSKRELEVLSEMTARGVRIRLLTNSLASTDVLAVHAAYSKYRSALLAAGVELHEYRADAERPVPKDHIMRTGSGDSALHSKVRVYDRRIVWVGSANSDPRSRRINTEAGLLIESEALAERLLKVLEQDFSLRQSWLVTLEDGQGGGTKQITWVGEQDGQRVRMQEEPGGGLLRALSQFFYAIMPNVEDLL